MKQFVKLQTALRLIEGYLSVKTYIDMFTDSQY